MIHQKKRFLTILMVAAVLLGNISPAWAMPYWKELKSASAAAPATSHGDRAPYSQAKALLQAQVKDQLQQTDTASFIVEAALSGEAGKDALKAAIAAAGIPFTYDRDYSLVLNGFSGQTTYANALKIASLPETAGVNAAAKYTRPLQSPGGMRALSADPGLLSSNMVSAPQAWVQGYQGTGQVIAILDTGGDVTHQDFRLRDASKAKYPTEAAMNAVLGTAGLAGKGKWYSDKVPYAWNYADKDQAIKAEGGDSMHGQHVAGSAAANGNTTSAGALGVAPEAQLLIMRVFGAGSSTTDDTIYVDAIDDAVKLKADSVNMSLGSTAGSIRNTGELTIKALENASKAGTIVNIAAGNEASFGSDYDAPYAIHPDYGVVGSPAVAPLSLAVASVENTAIAYTHAIVIDGKPERLPYNPSSVSVGASLLDQFLPFVDCGLGLEKDFADKDLTGKIALMQRGTITFVEKINRAKENGALLAIIYNHASGGDAFINMVVDNTQIPSVFLRHKDGVFLREKCKGSSISLKNILGTFDNPNAGKMSDFSSWGVSAEGDFKPEITAPGGQIYSTLNDNQYGNMSGTSMATPHVAGGVAVVKERVQKRFPSYTGELQYKVVKNLLMSTALPLKEPGADTYISPRKQGAGVMNLNSAVTSEQIVVDANSGISKINLRETKGTFILDMYVYNYSSDPVTFQPEVTVSTDKISDGSVTFQPQLIQTLSPNSFTVEPDSHSHLEIPVDISSQVPALKDQMPNGFYVEGFVVLKRSGDNGQIGLPFVGFCGSWDALTVVENSIYSANLGEEYPFYYGLFYQQDLDFRPPGMWYADLPYETLKKHKAPNLNPGFTHFASSVENVFRDDKGELMEDYYFILGESPGFSPWDDKGAILLPQKSDFRGDKLTISPNGDKKVDYGRFFGTFLRNYMDFRLDVYSGEISDSNLIYTNAANEEIDNGVKNYYNADPGEPRSTSAETWIWDGKDKNGAVVADGLYTVAVSARPEFAKSTPQIQTYAMHVDTVAPKVFHTHFDESTRRFTMEPMDSGSGIREIEVIASSGANGGTAPSTPASVSISTPSALTVAEDGSFTVPQGVSLADVRVQVTDWGFNSKIATAQELLDHPDVKPSQVLSAASIENRSVAFGTTRDKLSLPEKVMVTIQLPDGSSKQVEMAVRWMESTPAYDGQIPGNYVFTGVLSMPDEHTINPKDVTVSLTVSVEAKPQPPTPPTPPLPQPEPKPTPSISTGGPGFSDPLHQPLESVPPYAEKPVASPKPIPTPGPVTKPSGLDPSPASSPSVPHAFVDVDHHWAKAAIDYVVDKGYFKGLTPTTFGPDVKMTRGMLVTVLYQMNQDKTPGSQKVPAFPDVKEGAWYAKGVQWAASHGIVAGYSDGTFKPDQRISREEMAVILAQYLGAKDLHPAKTEVGDFADQSSIALWAASQVKEIHAMGLMGGRPGNRFDPKAPLTRGEMAQILVQLDTLSK